MGLAPGGECESEGDEEGGEGSGPAGEEGGETGAEGDDEGAEVPEQARLADELAGAFPEGVEDGGEYEDAIEGEERPGDGSGGAVESRVGNDFGAVERDEAGHEAAEGPPEGGDWRRGAWVGRRAGRSGRGRGAGGRWRRCLRRGRRAGGGGRRGNVKGSPALDNRIGFPAGSCLG